MAKLTNLQRLLLALGNKQYLTEEQYNILLEENALVPEVTYDFSLPQEKYALLKT